MYNKKKRLMRMPEAPHGQKAEAVPRGIQNNDGDNDFLCDKYWTVKITMIYHTKIREE